MYVCACVCASLCVRPPLCVCVCACLVITTFKFHLSKKVHRLVCISAKFTCKIFTDLDVNTHPHTVLLLVGSQVIMGKEGSNVPMTVCYWPFPIPIPPGLWCYGGRLWYIVCGSG